MLKIKNQYVTVFNSKLEDTYKVANRNVSVRGPKLEDGSYKTENWNARFVGKAKDFVEMTKEGALISISGEVHNEYNKETGKTYTYILVTDAELYI